jgi:hypothetical protein
MNPFDIIQIFNWCGSNLLILLLFRDLNRTLNADNKKACGQVKRIGVALVSAVSGKETRQFVAYGKDRLLRKEGGKGMGVSCSNSCPE